MNKFEREHENPETSKVVANRPNPAIQRIPKFMSQSLHPYPQSTGISRISLAIGDYARHAESRKNRHF